MKKQLINEDTMNELKGGSLFFQRSAEEDAAETAGEVEAPRKRSPRKRPQAGVEEPAKPSPLPSSDGAATVRSEDLTTAVEPPSPAPQFSNEEVETIRKAVKQLGKEATFCRFTIEEKSALSEIIYHYKRNGIRTSENEIIRTAVNYLLENYQANGTDSLLAKVLAKLNA